MNNSELRTEDSVQAIKYLGRVSSLYAHGTGVAVEPVRTVWKHSKKGARHHRCAISIHPFGLCVYEEIANGTYKSVWTDAIENISYCVAEPLHRRIFAWIARSQPSNDLECHVVLCKTRKQSCFLAELLAKTFYQSYQQQQQQQQSIPMVPNQSTRCSVCDTISRQRQSNQQMPSFENHSHHRCDGNLEEHQGNDDYEHIAFQASAPVARAYVRTYEENSINSSSHRSIDYDTAMIDEESMRPMEYYRR